MQTRQNRLSGLGCASIFLSLMVSSLIGGGCSETAPFTGEHAENQMPVVRLTSGPVEGDSVQYNVHFYWLGDDPDGEIDHYEIALTDGDPIGFDPEDTTGADKWTVIRSTDTLIVTSADELSSRVTINDAPYAIYDKIHTFFIKAVDDRGGVSETAHRSFNSWTIAPHVLIDEPRANASGGVQSLSPVIHFSWHGKDPIDNPWNYQEVDSIRYLWSNFRVDLINDLNNNPADFDHLWCDWLSIDAPGDSGRSTILGDDEIMPTGRTYFFAVQAKDEAGAISSVFNYNANVLAFRVMTPTGPIINIEEAFLGNWSFIGHDLDPALVKVPPGYKMDFKWTADASSYGAVVSTYRYGWDISDLSDPNLWETMPLPNIHGTTAIFYSGIHTLYIEATDNLGIKSICSIEVDIISLAMERDLLWIDDYPSLNFTQEIFAFPTEAEHDDFWTDVCMGVPDFLPTRDIFDISQNSFSLPPLDLVYRYKNIIWTYSPAVDMDEGSVWTRLINYGRSQLLNFIPYYMRYGGHIWTCGSPQRTGGLGAVLSTDGGFSNYRQYPCNLECDLFDPSPACTSTEGRLSMPYVDFCVSVIDKVDGPPKSWSPFYRERDFDAMSYAYVDPTNSITDLHPGLPARLELWSMVTQPGMFFDTDVRGFYYVEVYNPDYWMSYIGIQPQDCLHPMYRMKTRVPRSVLNDQTVAFWITKHADAVAPDGMNCPAPSVHFGVPLWFFDRAQVDSIAAVIFEEWQILD